MSIPVYIYTILVVLSIICLVAVSIDKERNHKEFVLMVAIIVVSNLGYLSLSTAKTIEVAMLSNKFVYLHGCFGQMLALFIICDICKIKIHEILKRLLIFFSFVLFILVWTADYTTIYYRRVWIEFVNGATVFRKEYGPAHNLYIYSIILYMIAIIGVVIYAAFNKKFVATKYLVVLAITQALSVLSLIVQRLLHLNFEVTAIFFVLCAYVIAWGSRGISSYDFAANLLRLKNERESGYIFFDKKLNFMACDKTAYFYFPELAFKRVSKKLTDIENPTLLEFLEFTENSYKTHDYSNHITKTIGNKTFRVSVIPQAKGKGLCLAFEDHTPEMKYLNIVEDYNKNLAHMVEEKTADINQIKNKLVVSMAAMVESRDNSTGGHIRRTSDVVAVFAKKLLEENISYNLTPSFLSMVTKAAPMHDLGKIAVDDVILRKNGKFTDEEYEIMKRHSVEGARIVFDILDGVEDPAFVTIATNVAHYHHEKWNGCGYPSKLSNTEIPVEARIMALADVFDALVSKRCYKEAFSFEKAFSIIESELGDHFDPVLGQVFLKCRSELISLYTSYPE